MTRAPRRVRVGRSLYGWNSKPEILRAVLVALGAWLVQQPVDTLDQLWSSDQPVKAIIALVIAAAQFVIARLLAAYPTTPPPAIPPAHDTRPANERFTAPDDFRPV